MPIGPYTISKLRNSAANDCRSSAEKSRVYILAGKYDMRDFRRPFSHIKTKKPRNARLSAERLRRRKDPRFHFDLSLKTIAFNADVTCAATSDPIHPLLPPGLTGITGGCKQLRLAAHARGVHFDGPFRRARLQPMTHALLGGTGVYSPRYRRIFPIEILSVYAECTILCRKMQAGVMKGGKPVPKFLPAVDGVAGIHSLQIKAATNRQACICIVDWKEKLHSRSMDSCGQLEG